MSFLTVSLDCNLIDSVEKLGSKLNLVQLQKLLDRVFRMCKIRPKYQFQQLLKTKWKLLLCQHQCLLTEVKLRSIKIDIAIKLNTKDTTFSFQIKKFC